MRCANSCIGASEDDNMLHGLRFRTWTYCFPKVIGSEEVKEEINGILKGARDTKKEISHFFDARNGVPSTEYSMLNKCKSFEISQGPGPSFAEQSQQRMVRYISYIYNSRSDVQSQIVAQLQPLPRVHQRREAQQEPIARCSAADLFRTHQPIRRVSAVLKRFEDECLQYLENVRE